MFQWLICFYYKQCLRVMDFIILASPKKLDVDKSKLVSKLTFSISKHLYMSSQLNLGEPCREEQEWQIKKELCCSEVVNLTHGLILLENLCRKMRIMAVRTARVVHMVLLPRTSFLWERCWFRTLRLFPLRRIE